MKLWKVSVITWGWDNIRTFYFRSKEEAREVSNKYPASSGVKYAGNFTEKNAKQLLCEDED